MIRTLEAFQSPPKEVLVEGPELFFRWDDGQECLMLQKQSLMPGREHQRVAEDSFRRFWRFDTGTEITDKTRSNIRKRLHHKKLAADIFIDGQSVASRMSSDGKNWTLESTDPFLTNATRTMRFDREGFLKMIRVADEVDFTSSPVCFRHSHGRGLLVERTAILDTPDFEPYDD